MAPTAPRTRSKGVAKQVTRKTRSVPKQTTDSWQLAKVPAADDNDSDIENEDPNDDPSQALAIEQQTSQTLEQWRRLTAGLERQVEAFAENLDRFLDELRPEEEYDAVHDLVLSFKDAAGQEAEKLQAEAGRERREQLAREWIAQANLATTSQRSGSEFSVTRAALQPRSVSSQAFASPQAQELRLHKDEAGTWELFRITLEQHYNPSPEQVQAERQAELDKLGPAHRYTPEVDLYQEFTITNELARERSLVKTWLEHAKYNSKDDVQDIMSELDQRAHGGQVYWARGWMQTREKVKGEKRLRTWPAPDSSPLPQLRAADTNDLLVTSLDPDALSRQHRTLEKQDLYHERALWIASWEMLRRGLPWSEICEWAEKQKEGWRAALLARGLAGADALSLVAWRQACFAASQGKCSCDHEAAVFGLFGGNVTAVEKVCHTVDDRLFAHYSAALVQQFDFYLASSHPDRVPERLRADLGNPSAVAQAEAAHAAIMQLIKQLRSRTDTGAESVDPLKMIQAYLLANEAESLIHTVGSTVSEAQKMKQRSVAALPSSSIIPGNDLPEAGIAKNPASLRITAHIAIALQLLRTSPLDPTEAENEDNVIAAYIYELTAAGKREMTPLYASRLQPDRCYTAMAIVLEGVTETRERETILSLMEQKGIDVSTVLWNLVRHVLEDVVNQSPDAKPTSILQFTKEEPELYPGQRIDLLGEPDVASSLDQALVRHLEWFLLLPQHWELTFRALTLALRSVLARGRFACARLIVETFKTEFICQDKTFKILGRSIDLFSPASQPAERDEALQWETMQRQARTYYELEQLVNVYELLFAWRKQEQRYAHANPRSPSVPKELKDTLAELNEAMEPILDPEGFLLNTIDDAEEDDIAAIRQAYVTDAIVAYNTVLFAAGRLISRDTLLKSMDLATIVARESTQLTETFMAAGRLKELVTSFAHSSRAILVMKATGKPWKPRYERKHGRDVSIWDVAVPEQNGVAAIEQAALLIG